MTTPVLDIKDILAQLPHRYPFVLVDKVLELEPGKRILAQKNVTYNEPFFPGHFPIHPVMPGVLIMEALAQAAGVLSFNSMDDKPSDKSVFYFVGIDNCRFKRPVVPGDVLMLDVSIRKISRGIWMYQAKAVVDGKVVAEADLMCTSREV
ncbi:3-hydroxyacyl-ACP dehydratase FabZ [Limnobacter humi]|uniref:3-hydroxyacyl-[acyl-carrier-protein] dehydratase FabZ n=1 Tax=Limnobacter humi TaxID=1778671 RepID=A0ABT1WET0_9BURK|nr:3-hydroxyacyl-ACP dehydratase FabZ [Limnobacter humi]MCQ8896025.1 3-hydroxyacyl-ACP dehydratase FabZ [Limnobacter humi]